MTSHIRRMVADRLTADQFGHAPWKDAFDRIAWSVRVLPLAKKRTSLGEPQFHLYYKELQNMGAVKVYGIDLLKHWASMLPQAQHSNDPIKLIRGENTGLAIHIDPAHLNRVVLENILEERNMYGISSDYHRYRENANRRIEENPQNQKIVLEFSSPNIAKEFHAGHLRSTLLGNFISNISTALGHDVRRINYLGDWGTQFGLLGVGYQKYGSQLELDSNPVKHLYDIYVKINKEAKDADGNPNEVYARGLEFFRKLENGDPECLAFWKSCRKHSIEQFKKMYERLGVEFDEYHGEAMYDKIGAEIVNDLKEKGIAVTEKLSGVTYVPVPIANKPDDRPYHASVLKSDGSTLYLTRDIAALIDRYDRYEFDRMLYVVEKGQFKHFESLVGILPKLGHIWADRPATDFHVQFGRVEGMSSRKGTIVLLKDILNQAQACMLDNMKNTDTTKVTDPEEMENIAEILGKSAIIIQDLKERRAKNYKFGWDRMMMFKGDTGVFLQYCHARLKNLETHNNHVPLTTDCDISLLSEECACSLVHHLARYDEILHMSYQELEPYHLSHYLFMLSRLANIAFRELKVHGEPMEVAKARLLLFHCTRTVLASGLNLLGVQPLDRL